MISFFQRNKQVLAVMSLREDGSMKLFNSSNLNLENRKRFFEKIGIPENQVFAAEIVHGNKVAIVNKDSDKIIAGVDGLVTKDQNIFLSVTIADCIPVFAYDSSSNVIAIAHCGWRSIVSGIIRNLIKKVIESGGKVENIKIAIGQGINVCHFEIGTDIVDKFCDYPEFIKHKEDKIFVDLKGIIREQLREWRIAAENIENKDECTFENQKFFSFRRDNPKLVEAMIGVIGMRSDLLEK